jgi:hypothetical protein
MPEQVLHVQFTGVVLDRPGREGVAEAVGVHLRDPGRASESSQHLLEPVWLERDVLPQLAMPRDREEQRAR